MEMGILRTQLLRLFLLGMELLAVGFDFNPLWVIIMGSYNPLCWVKSFFHTDQWEAGTFEFHSNAFWEDHILAFISKYLQNKNRYQLSSFTTM